MKLIEWQVRWRMWKFLKPVYVETYDADFKIKYWWFFWSVFQFRGYK